MYSAMSSLPSLHSLHTSGPTTTTKRAREEYTIEELQEIATRARVQLYNLETDDQYDKLNEAIEQHEKSNAGEPEETEESKGPKETEEPEASEEPRYWGPSADLHEQESGERAVKWTCMTDPPQEPKYKSLATPADP
tara:strand:+ start:175 stop:585 length:411 start_codon:yes stop_codon:yes gene_type:complete